MATAVQLPALSPTMKEGRITKWLKHEGDVVSSGTPIAECETDKSNLEIEAYDDGVLLKIVVPEGGVALVGAPIAYIGQKGESIANVPVSIETPKQAPVAPVVVSSGQTKVDTSVSTDRVRASPLARKIASATGVDLRQVAGSGPNGRVIKRDLESIDLPRQISSVTTTRALTQMQKVIATRLGEVKPGVPHFYLQIDVEMDGALALKDEAKANDFKVSVNDLIVKAAAMAVRRVPKVNVSMVDGAMQDHASIDIGVAVAIEDGLVTPVVKAADQKSVSAIAEEVRALVDRSRRKVLKPDEYSGGSLTVSNLGMYGIDRFTAIINPPQSLILAVGQVQPQVVVRNDAMVIRQMMSITLSGDHRVIDGAVGALYLKELRGFLEHPLRLAL